MAFCLKDQYVILVSSVYGKTYIVSMESGEIVYQKDFVFHGTPELMLTEDEAQYRLIVNFTYFGKGMGSLIIDTQNWETVADNIVMDFYNQDSNEMFRIISYNGSATEEWGLFCMSVYTLDELIDWAKSLP